MPKVRILSGNQAGAVVEMSVPEAESAVGCGYAEEYAEPPKAKPPNKTKPKEPERKNEQ